MDKPNSDPDKYDDDLVLETFRTLHSSICNGHDSVFDQSPIFKWNSSKNDAHKEMAKAVLNRCDESGTTVLMAAIQHKRSNFVDRLLKLRELDIKQGVEGITPLHLAIQTNSTSIAKKLLEKGASPNKIKKQKENEETALLLSTRYGNTRMIDLLNKHGFDFEKYMNKFDNVMNFTPFLSLCYNQHKQCLQHLIKLKWSKPPNITLRSLIDINARDKDDNTGLHLAVKSQSLKDGQIFVKKDLLFTKQRCKGRYRYSNMSQ